jgi:transposase
MPTPIAPTRVTNQQRQTLESWVRATTIPQRVARRARIVLAAADGLGTTAIAEELGLTRTTVLLWRTRFAEGGCDALVEDAPRSGRPREITPEKVEWIVDQTRTTTPPDATHWSTRTMAEHAGVSPEAVRRIWQAHGIKPHLIRTFKLSNDPDFVAKLRDVVGLYLAPPDHALVLSVDEKSQIQALDRTQPSLPMKKGRAGTMTHDYKRNGLVSLFAAMDVATGVIFHRCAPRHRHEEFLAFLKQLQRETPRHLDLHLIVDNYRTHKHATVLAWLEKHPRFHLHFVPTSSSWLNVVERFFAEITRKRIRRGSFRNAEELTTAINEYIAHHNDDPQPFVWTAKANDILKKVARCRATLEAGH